MVYTGKIFDKHGIKVLVIPGFILLISMTFYIRSLLQERHTGL